MAKKLSRPDADIEALAADLAARYSPALGVEPWLRKNVARLTRLVRNEGWSWADIGRAMTMAGIVYQSGAGWTGTLLAMKASQARLQVRARRAKRAAEAEARAQAKVPKPAVPRPVSATPAPPPFAPMPPPAPERPKFALARIRESHPLPPPAPEPQPDPAPAPAATHDAGAVHRQFFGKKNRPTTESSE